MVRGPLVVVKFFANPVLAGLSLGINPSKYGCNVLIFKKKSITFMTNIYLKKHIEKQYSK